jgi:hypothetical protein
MAVYIVPSAPGWCRMITRFYSAKAGGARRPGLFGLFRMVRGWGAGGGGWGGVWVGGSSGVGARRRV